MSKVRKDASISEVIYPGCVIDNNLITVTLVVLVLYMCFKIIVSVKITLLSTFRVVIGT